MQSVREEPTATEWLRICDSAKDVGWPDVLGNIVNKFII